MSQARVDKEPKSFSTWTARDRGRRLCEMTPLRDKRLCRFGVVPRPVTRLLRTTAREGREVGEATSIGESGGSAPPSPATARTPSPEELTAVVALDGPAGSGKSTVARRVASALGWRFVDTGATYRAVTLAVLRSGVDVADPAAVTAVAKQAQVVLGTEPGHPSVMLDGEDVSSAIRSPEVTAAVSAVSAVPEVRTVLIALQRQAMGTTGAVVEGRDIATVVAPHAALTVYLDARPEVRAARRAGEVHAGVAPRAGDDATDELRRREDVLASLMRRDALDSRTNQLVAADGAVHLDTSDLTLDEVVDVVAEWARQAVEVGTR